ncbi:MAG: ferritin-like domain-containing protein [Bradymonadaceae bacterium]
MQRHEGKEGEESGTEKVRQTAKEVTETVKSAFTENVDSFDKLYWEEIEEMYDAENRIHEALGTMAESASTPELREAFEEHRQKTDGQIRRLEEIFDHHGREPERATCQGCKGLIDEGTMVINNTEACSICDAAMIAAAQAIEHYEMAKYGTLCAYAERLGFSDDIDKLKTTLDQEKETDKKLSELAEDTINPQAERESS